jgi:hypothetical protein
LIAGSIGAVGNPVAWSYSRLNNYEQCPRKFWHESVGKTIPFEASEAMTYGNEVHKAFELFLKNGKKLPLHLLHWTPIMQKIASAPGEKVVEQQICLNAKYEPVEWYAKDAWLRVKSDLTQINGDRAICWDFKTGKQQDDFTQLKLNAAVTFHLDPSIQMITMAFLWTKTKAITRENITLSKVPDVWGNLLPRVARYQEAHDQQNFPPRQGFLCAKFCKVTSCQFNGV